MNAINVDDEKLALDNFRLTVQDFPEIKNLELFREGEMAVRWVREHPVDVRDFAFKKKIPHFAQVSLGMTGNLYLR